MHLPMTYWLLSGSSEYSEFVPGVDGATADCLGVEQDLLAFGYPESQVMAFCGTAMRKTEIVQAVNSLSGRMTAGDTLVVFWIGHGGFDLADPGQKLWQTSDGLFVREGEDGNGYSLTGIDPRLLESALRRAVPPDTEIIFLTDTARGGVFKETFSLEGPTADDFKDINPHTRAASPNSRAGASGALRQVLKGCLRRSLAMADDGQISTTEAAICLGITSSVPVIPMIGSGEWTSSATPVFLYPPAPTTKIPAPDHPRTKRSALRPVVRFGGLGIGVVGAVAGTVTFIEASNIYATAEEQDFQVPESTRPDIERYDDLKVATYALWGASLLGLATFGGSYLVVTPTPQGVAISGFF